MLDPGPQELCDGNLRLRPPCRQEVELYASWWRDEEVLYGFCCEKRTAADLDEAFPELEAEARDAGHWTDFVIEVDGRPVGSIWFSRWDVDLGECDLNVLIGNPQYRSSGVARRAIRLLCAWAFPVMDLRRVFICPREDHIPALRCYLAAGARMGGIREEVVIWRGEVVCFRELYFLREDFDPPLAPIAT